MCVCMLDCLRAREIAGKWSARAEAVPLARWIVHATRWCREEKREKCLFQISFSTCALSKSAVFSSAIPHGFAVCVATVPWDSGRGSGTLSHGKGSAQRARLEFRRSARSLVHPSEPVRLARRPYRSGFTRGFRMVGAERIRSVHPAQRRHRHVGGFCLPPRFPLPPPPPVRSARPSSPPLFHFRPLRHAARREISPARDTHFSRLTVVEGREITTAERKGSQPR